MGPPFIVIVHSAQRSGCDLDPSATGTTRHRLAVNTLRAGPTPSAGPVPLVRLFDSLFHKVIGTSAAFFQQRSVEWASVWPRGVDVLTSDDLPLPDPERSAWRCKILPGHCNRAGRMGSFEQMLHNATQRRAGGAVAPEGNAA